MSNAIFIIVNSNHFHYAIAFLNSLYKNWPSHPMVLCNYAPDLTQEQVDKLKSYDNLQLNLLNLSDGEIGNRPTYKSEGMCIAYAKLRIWSSLYDQYDTILYLDVDTLVLKPLDDLINRNEFTIFRAYHNFEFLNKSDQLRSLLEEDSILSHFDDRFKHPGVSGNSGVMVIPKAIRTKENYDILMYLLNRYKNYNTWADQAVINLWMLKTSLKADLTTIRYNFLTFLLNENSEVWKDYNSLEVEFSNLHIIHFVIKPEDLMYSSFIHNSENSFKYSKKIYELFQHYSNL